MERGEAGQPACGLARLPTKCGPVAAFVRTRVRHAAIEGSARVLTNAATGQDQRGKPPNPPTMIVGFVLKVTPSMETVSVLVVPTVVPVKTTV